MAFVDSLVGHFDLDMLHGCLLPLLLGTSNVAQCRHEEGLDGGEVAVGIRLQQLEGEAIVRVKPFRQKHDDLPLGNALGVVLIH